MGKYFGTDGVRGEKQCRINARIGFKLGRFWYYVLSQYWRRNTSGICWAWYAYFWWNVGHTQLLVSYLLGFALCWVWLQIPVSPSSLHRKPALGLISARTKLDNGIKFLYGDGLNRMMIATWNWSLFDGWRYASPRPSAQGLGTVMNI